jgi:AraC-like DNA-binding protein
MNKTLFNLNDLSLILVMSQCLLLAVLLLLIHRGKRVSNLLLALFLLGIGLEAFDTLIYWSQAVKETWFGDSVTWFVVLKFSGFVQGPLLLWYTRTVIFADVRFKRVDLYHLLPLASFPLFLLLIFGSIGSEKLAQGVFDYNVLYQNLYYRTLIFSQDLLIVVYCITAWWYMHMLRIHVKNNYSSITTIDRNWLRLLIGGFLAVSIWKCIAPLLSLLNLAFASHVVGLFGNYLDYLLVNLLVFYSIAHSDIVHAVLVDDVTNKAEKNEHFDETQLARVQAAMREQALYLEPELTLEQLADHLHMSPRLVSNIINRTWNQNFFEFINFYRVEKAKELLLDQQNKSGMLDVMADAGFNSKSAFNRFFKKYAKMTPTEFRRANANG